MSEHEHGAGGAQKRAELRAWRDEAVRLSREHELRYHAGERCRDHAVGMVAFVAHALGLHSGEPGWVYPLWLALAEYEEQHGGPSSNEGR